MIKFYKKVYNSTDPSIQFGFHEIPTRFCEYSDFNTGGNNTQSSFYPTNSVSISDLNDYTRRMKCPVNKSDISIMGNFDSSAASVVMVVLETCNN